MSRAITIGNGNILVGLDTHGHVRDFYYPFVGHSNHVSGASGSYTHRIGVWADGVLHWLSDSTWVVDITYAEYSGASDISAHNTTLGVSLHIIDVVHNEKNIFVRDITVTNTFDTDRTIKIFFAQEFRITESRRGDTAFYDPRVRALVHYKGHNVFLVYGMHDGIAFSEYSVGLFGIEGREGSFLDAKDGILSKNAIEHGSVDSIIGTPLAIKAHESTQVYYWIVVDKNITNAHKLHADIIHEQPRRMIESTKKYWQAWTKNQSRDFSPLGIRVKKLYDHSLVVMRIHTDNRGGIIASSDSDMLNQGRDTYSYVWPRDAAFIAHAFDRAGHIDVTQRFFLFMAQCMEPEGYMMHKYRIDGVLGSSWHPWIQDGVFKLPIQEDETATILFMLNEHYNYAKDLEFIESLYNPFIEKVANFLCTYIEPITGLPIDSYDLWEEKNGSSTYTASSVYGGLVAASKLSTLLGKHENALRYRKRAESIKQSIIKYLYDEEIGVFLKLVRHRASEMERDITIDMSSIFGLFEFGVLDVSDIRMHHAFTYMIEKLHVPTRLGGYMRYEGDTYYKAQNTDVPNAWCITTLWVARYYIRLAQSKNEIAKAYDLIQWVCDRASNSNMLPEQISSVTGEHLSATPLVWSHAEFVITVDEFLKKIATLK